MEPLPYQNPQRDVQPAGPNRPPALIFLPLGFLVVLAVIILWPKSIQRETVEGWIAVVPIGSSPTAYQSVFEKHGFECSWLAPTNPWSVSDGGYREGDLNMLQGMIDSKLRSDGQWMRWVVTIRFDSDNRSRSVAVDEYWTPD